MQFEWIYTLENINWVELSNLYKIAPLGDKSPKDLKEVFSNSRYKCFIYESDVLVGVGRALADGADCSYICDIAVLPNFQGSGIGKSLVTKLVELSEGHTKIILYTVPGKELFYQKLGFKRMSTAMAIFHNQTQAIESGLISDK